MSAPKPPCVTLPAWLRANLGPKCLGCLNGQSGRALSAAVQLVNLWSYCDDTAEPLVLAAFRCVVLTTDEHDFARELIYHSIAHVANWSDRDRLFALAGLPPLVPKCKCLYDS